MDPLPFPTNRQSPCARVFKLILERVFDRRYGSGPNHHTVAE